MAKKRTPRTQLLNGCSVSAFSVYPANWNEPGASLKKDWYIFYRFYDPEFRNEPKYKYGKLVPVAGMNEYKTLMERRQMTRDLLDQEQREIIELGYNPITHKYMKEAVASDIVYALPPETPFIEAMDWALEKKECTNEVKTDIRSVLRYTTTAARQLRYDEIPIEKVRRIHLLAIFEQLKKNKGVKWTNNNHNHYRSHLSMLFEVLVLWCAIDLDPTDKIPIKKHAAEKRRILTLEERIKIDTTLRATNFRLWLLMQIFYYTGCRRAEIMRAKGKDINLDRQKLKVVRQKGNNYKVVEYTIQDVAIPYWKMALAGCAPDDIVFSKWLKPGAVAINPRQVTKRWRLWVKKKMGIDADFYSLKYLQTTQISEKHGTDIAAAFNNESVRMIEEHYDVEHDHRQHEKAKKQTKQPFA